MASLITVTSGRVLFSCLAFLMLGTLIYAICAHGSPFGREEFTPWMIATIVDFYINAVAIAVWMFYRELSWIGSIFWISMLVCFGSISTCTYIALRLFMVSSEESLMESLHYILLKHPIRIAMVRKQTFPPVMIARILFGTLGCVMLATLIYTLIIDGSPFRRELLTPWMVVTLVDFYINIAAISVWISYKESSLVTSMFWIVLLICFGSISTCAYIVLQLLRLSSQGPLFLVLLNAPDRMAIEETSKNLPAEETCDSTEPSVSFI